MGFTKVLVLAAISGALAVSFPGAAPQNFAHGLKGRGLEDTLECGVVVAEQLTLAFDIPALPTPPATATDIQIPEITDPCVLPSATALASEAIASYSSELQAWEFSHSNELRSIGSACSGVQLFEIITSAVSVAGSKFDYGLKFTQICDTVLAPIVSTSGTAIATATATAIITGSPGAASTNSVNAAPRETGIMVAAVAAAGAAFAAM